MISNLPSRCFWNTFFLLSWNFHHQWICQLLYWPTQIIPPLDLLTQLLHLDPVEQNCLLLLLEAPPVLTCSLDTFLSSAASSKMEKVSVATSSGASTLTYLTLLFKTAKRSWTNKLLWYMMYLGIIFCDVANILCWS